MSSLPAGESVWLHLDIIGQVLGFCRQLFPVVEYAYTTIPTYPSGQIGFVLCSKEAGRSLRHPARYRLVLSVPRARSRLPR